MNSSSLSCTIGIHATPIPTRITTQILQAKDGCSKQTILEDNRWVRMDTYRPTIISSASEHLGLINRQISTVKMVDEELKILVKLDTNEAIMTANIRPRAPEGRRFNTIEG